MTFQKPHPKDHSKWNKKFSAMTKLETVIGAIDSPSVHLMCCFYSFLFIQPKSTVSLSLARLVGIFMDFLFSLFISLLW